MNLLNWFFVFAGMFIGFIYISYSWGERRSASKELKDDPRVKGLVWCVSGLVLIFISDWQRLLRNVSSVISSEINVADFIVYYLCGFIGGALLSLFVLTVKVSVEARTLDSRHKGIFMDGGFSPVMEFILFGYRSYENMVANALKSYRDRGDVKIRAAATSLLDSEKESLSLALTLKTVEIERRTRLSSEVSVMFSSSFDAYRGFLARKLVASDACRLILQRITIISSYYTKLDSARVNCNYMITQPRESLSQTEIDSSKFMFGDTDRYREFLLLSGHAKSGTNVIRLPIEPYDSHDIWPRLTLPGAPSAFVHRKPVLCLTHKIDFARDVPPEIQEKQITYLLSQQFNAIVSLPIPRTSDNTAAAPPIGVLNIDLTFDSARLKSEVAIDSLPEFAVLLSPFLTLIGDILTSSTLRLGKERKW